MKGELLDPLVPVAFVELCTICRMSEQSWSQTDLRPECFVECPETPGAEFLPIARVPIIAGSLTQESRSILDRSADRCYYTAKSKHFLASPGVRVTDLLQSCTWSSKSITVASKESSSTPRTISLSGSCQAPTTRSYTTSLPSTKSTSPTADSSISKGSEAANTCRTSTTGSSKSGCDCL